MKNLEIQLIKICKNVQKAFVTLWNLVRQFHVDSEGSIQSRGSIIQSVNDYTLVTQHTLSRCSVAFQVTSYETRC